MFNLNHFIRWKTCFGSSCGENGVVLENCTSTSLAKMSPFVDTEFRPVTRTHVASQKGPLDGARDPPSFSARVVDPTHSSRDVLVNLTLQLIRRESLSVIKGGTCRCFQTVPNVERRSTK